MVGSYDKKTPLNKFHWVTNYFKLLYIWVAHKYAWFQPGFTIFFLIFQQNGHSFDAFIWSLVYLKGTVYLTIQKGSWSYECTLLVMG